ncbi:MAG: hypothetical protein ACYC2U_04105 [Candidatus Amoebophilus sp.]
MCKKLDRFSNCQVNSILFLSQEEMIKESTEKLIEEGQTLKINYVSISVKGIGLILGAKLLAYTS